MYVVTGATGNTGRVVAEALLAAGADVQVVGRSKGHLRPLVEKGAQPFIGSLDDAQTMSIAFSGAVGVYCMIPPRYEAPDFPAWQRAVGESLAAAVHEAGVNDVVFLSSIGAQHMEGTGPIAGLRREEDRLNSLEAVNVLSLRAGFFMENFFMQMDVIRGMGVVGLPMRGDVPCPLIATKDIGEYAAERLLRRDFSGKCARELLGPRDMTMSEATRVLGAAIEKPDLEYVQFPFEDAERALLEMGLSASGASTLLQLYRGFNDGLVVATEERGPENTTATTFEEFGRVFAEVYAGGKRGR
ncbi:MAG: NmrA family NAD(P)-binding protein [Gemmatimonadota bacterium]|nr:MAG: NmrA family NAD(P)-binding protein [Gemmatimonadota bacterium]